MCSCKMKNALNPARVEDYKDYARSSVFEGIITDITGLYGAVPYTEAGFIA